MICGPLVVTVASNWSICAPNWLLIKPTPATTKPRIAAGPIEASAKLATLAIDEVILPRADRPALAALPKTPARPVTFSAKTPTRPPRLLKAVPITLPKTSAFVPILPSAVPTLPIPVVSGVSVAIASFGFNSAHAATAAGPISAILALILSMVSCDNSPFWANSPSAVLSKSKPDLILLPNPDISILTIDFSFAKAATIFGITAVTVSNASLIAGFKANKLSEIVFRPFALAASSNAVIILATPLTTAVFKFCHAVRIPPAEACAISAKPPCAPLSSIILSANC